MSETLAHVGRNLRLQDLRAKRGWSQEELARRSRVSLATVNRAETGVQTPVAVTQEKIAHALGVERREIWPDEEDAA